jgi:hypothetical protein
MVTNHYFVADCNKYCRDGAQEWGRSACSCNRFKNCEQLGIAYRLRRRLMLHQQPEEARREKSSDSFTGIGQKGAPYELVPRDYRSQPKANSWNSAR